MELAVDAAVRGKGETGSGSMVWRGSCSRVGLGAVPGVFWVLQWCWGTPLCNSSQTPQHCLIRGSKNES